MFQPLEFLKRNWVSIVLILIILFLAHTLFQSNAAEQSAREDARQSKAMVTKLVAEMKAKDEKHNAIMAAMDEDIKRYDSIVIDLQTALNESKKDVRWDLMAASRYRCKFSSYRFDSYCSLPKYLTVSKLIKESIAL